VIGAAAGNIAIKEFALLLTVYFLAALRVTIKVVGGGSQTDTSNYLMSGTGDTFGLGF